MSFPIAGLLRLAYNQLSGDISAAAERAAPGTRPSHGNVLEQLELHDGLRLTDLANGAGMTPQSIGELVDQLEALGYVQRRPDPSDRRVKRIYRTKKAEAGAAAAAGAVRETEVRLQEILGERRVEELKGDLIRIVQAWGGDIPPPPADLQNLP